MQVRRDEKCFGKQAIAATKLSDNYGADVDQATCLIWLQEESKKNVRMFESSAAALRRSDEVILIPEPQPTDSQIRQLGQAFDVAEFLFK